MNTIQKAILASRLVSPANLIRAVQAAIRRDRLESGQHGPRKNVGEKPAGSVVSVKTSTHGVQVHFENAHLCIQFLTPDFLFLGWNGASMMPSYAVCKTSWPTVEVHQERDPQGWMVTSQSLQVNIAGDGCLTFSNLNSETMRREHPIMPAGHGWQQVVSLQSEDLVCGLGERASPLNLRPGTYRFWNTDARGSYGPGSDPLYLCIPVWMCLGRKAGYLAFYDNSYSGKIYLEDEARIDFEGGPARYYLAFGPPAVLLDRYTALTGRPVLPPRWALGYHQSRWGYQNEAEMRRVYAGFKLHALPISGLMMDIDHQDGFRTFTLDQQRYPNLAGFAQQLATDDVHLVAIVDPGVKADPGFDLYQEGRQLDAYCKLPVGSTLHSPAWPGWAAFPDFTHPKVRTWWGKQYIRLVHHGIDGFWHDMNEPSTFNAWGDLTLPKITLHNLDGHGGDHLEGHNLYGLLMGQAGYDGLRQHRPGKRPFILTRAGWAGIQRYAWAWTGDVESSWQALRQTIPTVLGMGLSGLPYVGPDIGGFSGNPGPELFVRWFELAAFLPFFRNHSAFFLPRREPWEFGPEVLEITRKMLELRYSFLPYWYTLAWQAAHDGNPIVRPVFWDDPFNSNLRGVEDCFLVGSDLLVAPIVEKGQWSRLVHLPPGGWYELKTSQHHAGGQSVQVDAALDTIPVFARAGSILPRMKGKDLTLHLYPDAEGNCTGQLYSDAGDGFGLHRLDRFQLQPVKEGKYLLHSTSEGEYPWPYHSLKLEWHGTNQACVDFAGERLEFNPAGGRGRQ